MSKTVYQTEELRMKAIIYAVFAVTEHSAARCGEYDTYRQAQSAGGEQPGYEIRLVARRKNSARRVTERCATCGVDYADADECPCCALERDLGPEPPPTLEEIDARWQEYAREKGLCEACGRIDRVPPTVVCNFCWLEKIND